MYIRYESIRILTLVPALRKPIIGKSEIIFNFLSDCYMPLSTYMSGKRTQYINLIKSGVNVRNNQSQQDQDKTDILESPPISARARAQQL